MKSLIPFLIIIFISSTYGLDNALTGIVVNGLTHEIIENAVVHLQELNRYDVTNKKGQFEFRDVPAGKYTLKVTMLGYRPREEVILMREGINRIVYVHLFQVPIQSGTVVVTGEHPTHIMDEILGSTALIGKELQRDMGLTLAATLKNETGISMRSMGPAPSRPVVRGMGGDRVVINEDGIETRDLSSTSPDHALTVDSFTSERIEVIRGPKILLNTSSTAGGIINIIKDDIPTLPASNISGNLGLLGESANSGYLGSAVLNIPIYPLQIRGEITRKSADNLRTPLRELENSSFSNLSYSSGTSFNFGSGMVGAAYRQFESDYGIPGGFVGAHPGGVDISMMRRQFKGKANYGFNGGLIKNVELSLSRSYYRHREYEKSGLVGAEFSVFDYDASLKFNHNNLFFFDEGIAGISAEYRDFNVGGFVFTPPSTSLGLSSYIFQSYSGGNIEFQAAVRYGFNRITPFRENPGSRIGHIRERIFNTYSLSGALFYQLFSSFYTGIHMSKSSRVPTIEELFTEGPHLAAYSYETGNPDLRDESGIGTELLAYFKSEEVFFSVTLFRYDFSYFILPRNTGRINYATLLPVFASTGERALLTGIEGELHFHLIGNLESTASLSYTYGTLKNSGTPLASIPPVKSLIELRYTTPFFTIGLLTEAAMAQNRVDLFEERTAGYMIMGLFIQYVFSTGRSLHNISLSADNIFDKEYRNHLSRIKSVVPESGRNIRGTYRFYF
jgi:iron complex outermembrane recepter protein